MGPIFHVHEKILLPGELIPPGRWGINVLNKGIDHPFWEREQQMDAWRREKTSVLVSRLNCAFAFEDYNQAVNYAKEANQFVFQVIPTDEEALRARFDMLWVTWISEQNASRENKIAWIASYWAGRTTTDSNPNAIACWEWLFACPLKVLKSV
jgi:hypothetical protein